VIDAGDASAQPEIMLVTNVSGTTWTVTRGVEGTTTVAHTAGFTVKQNLTAASVAGAAVGSVFSTSASGAYIIVPPVAGSVLAGSLSAGYMRAVPILIPAGVTVSALGVNVTTLGAGETMRLGIYDDATGIPTNLMLDAGTIDASTTGYKEITGLTQALTPGRYWIVGCHQGGGTAQFTNAGNNPVGLGTSRSPSSDISVYLTGYYNSAGGVTAGLLSTFGGVTTTTGSLLPRIAMKVA
jgi:hypothetical protein